MTFKVNRKILRPDESGLRMTLEGFGSYEHTKLLPDGDISIKLAAPVRYPQYFWCCSRV